MGKHSKIQSIRIGSLNVARMVAAQTHSLAKLLSAAKASIDLLGLQEVHTPLPISIPGYIWLPGLERFERPDDHHGIGLLVRTNLQGRVTVVPPSRRP